MNTPINGLIIFIQIAFINIKLIDVTTIRESYLTVTPGPGMEIPMLAPIKFIFFWTMLMDVLLSLGGRRAWATSMRMTGCTFRNAV